VGRNIDDLVRGIENRGAAVAADRAFGCIHRLAANDAADILQGEPACGQFVRVDLNAHGGTLRSVKIHEPHTVHLRYLLRNDVFGVVVEFGERKAVGGQGQRQHRGFGGVGFMIGGRAWQALGQAASRRADGRLDILRRGVDVPRQIEFNGDVGSARRTGRGHLIDPGNIGELVFQRRGDRCRHGAPCV
ncbi:hypothetical protein BLX88_02385, partial [Bacillus obstructivus]